MSEVKRCRFCRTAGGVLVPTFDGEGWKCENELVCILRCKES